MRRVKDGLTKAQRYNRNMENIFAYAEKVNKNRMNWLRQQGVSEDEIQNAKANTGLGKDGLYNLVIKVARENGDRRLNSDILREIDDLEAIRNVKDGCGRKVKDSVNLQDYKVVISNLEGWSKASIGFEEFFNYPESKEFWMQDFLNGVADYSEKIDDIVVISAKGGDYYIEFDGYSTDAYITFSIKGSNKPLMSIANAMKKYLEEHTSKNVYIDKDPNYTWNMNTNVFEDDEEEYVSERDIERFNSMLNKYVSDSKHKVKDGYSNNSDYFGDWYGEGQIDFDAIINPEDDGDLYMVKIWGGSGYVLDVYLVKAYDEYDAIDIVFEWSYENEGANNIIFDYNYLSKLCHEDYEDEYWYGRGEGKPSDKMSYEEFEDEWFEYYIQTDNDLYARGENFFVDKVPQDMIEEQ